MSKPSSGARPTPADAPAVEHGGGGVLQSSDWLPPPKDEPLQRGDEVELAERALGLIEAPLEYRLVHDEGFMWSYNSETGQFGKVGDEVVERVVWEHAGHPVIVGTDKKTGEPRLKELKVGDRTAVGVRNICYKARKQEGFFYDSPAGCGFGNGYLALLDWGPQARLALGSPGPGWRCRFGYKFDYEPGMVPGQFLQVLEGIFDGDSDGDLKIQTLREFTGACVLGVAPKLGQCLVLLGSKARNGKSTVLDIIKACFPRGTWTALPPQELLKQDRRAALAGIRLNVVNEMPAADILRTDIFKKVITGDTIDARALYKDKVDVTPVAGHIIAANLLPRPRVDFTEGFWRRWNVLEFNNRFLPGKAVIGLADRVARAEAREIVCWAVEGVVEAARRGRYPHILSSEKALSVWKVEADQVAAFADEMLTVGDRWTPVSEVYTSYVKWCLDAGHSTCSKPTLTKRLEALNVTKTRGSAGMILNVTLR
jgi:P4 family phage/plasmid primase-like protien